MSTPNIRPTPSSSQRRSQRILLSVPVVVSGTRSNNVSFSERTSTLIVNAHGALIQLREHVSIGQKLRMQHSSTHEEQVCTVMDINPGNTGIPEVGVAFAEAYPHFWRVSFPPAEWSLRNPEAKHHAREPEKSSPSLVKK